MTTKVTRNMLDTSIVDNGNATALTIDTNENIGLAARLSVGTTTVGGGNTKIVTTGGTDNYIQLVSNTGTGGVSLGNAGSVFLLYTHTGALGSESFSERMRIDSSGNVGIGTSSPNAYTNYTVLTIDSPSSGTGSVIDLEYRTDRSLSMFSEGELSTIREIRNYPLAFGTNNTERMRIDASGNLLLGTTSAEQDSGAGVKLKDDGNGRCYLVGASDSGEGFSMHNGSVFRFFVGYNGTVNATTASISAISDERLKENIRPLDKGLEDILKLKPRLFDWKKGEGSDKKNVSGFIAQEAEEAGFEEFIGGWKHEELPDAKSFAQGGLIPALVKSIQQQQEQIKLLEQKIEVLENGD